MRPYDAGDDALNDRPAARRFLTRVETTLILGIGCASQVNAARVVPVPEAGLRLACRDRASGDVFEAEFGEVLHAQIVLRVGRDLEGGWTVWSSWYEGLLAASARRKP